MCLHISMNLCANAVQAGDRDFTTPLRLVSVSPRYSPPRQHAVAHAWSAYSSSSRDMPDHASIAKPKRRAVMRMVVDTICVTSLCDKPVCRLRHNLQEGIAVASKPFLDSVLGLCSLTTRRDRGSDTTQLFEGSPTRSPLCLPSALSSPFF